MILLSIIVISHNQREPLRRCLDSILVQEFSFEYEIIISDDASSDGSWELALEYASNYSHVKATQCNTDDYNPANNSARSGWNRCNGYKYAKGKYLAHIDGDDFIMEGINIYRDQVELLEKHPDCSCCMANDYILNEEEDISEAKVKHDEHFETGEILSSETYIKTLFRESHCFVYRRNENFHPGQLYGGYYVDAMITDYHLQFGDIVCLDEVGYVYVQYKRSIWNENIKRQDYKILTHALYIPLLIPKWKMAFLSSPRHLKKIIKVVQLAFSDYQMREDNLRWCSSFDRYLYRVFNRKLTFSDRVRLGILFLYIGFLIKVHPPFVFLYRMLDKLL